MRSLAELEQLKRHAQKELGVRGIGGYCRATFIVHMGTDGIAAGAREVLLAILDELKRLGIHDCRVTQTDVTGFGMKPPVVDVVTPGHRVETYTGVSPEGVRKIVAESLVESRVAAV
ncbi:MAG TPA: (2Fe-2S) ferredoxin domain-containing protein [Firmicutes bacterium]|nr:(2Fe-2S) ferredoxin domain-containing protein [Bacillota bacterium]